MLLTLRLDMCWRDVYFWSRYLDATEHEYSQQLRRTVGVIK
jgi:hypothetical protein